MNPIDPAMYWYAAARSYCRRVNAAWWWQMMTPLLIAGGVVAFVGVFWMRVRGMTVSVPGLSLALIGGVGLLAGVAWLAARRHFIAEDDGLVALEMHLKLHNALSAAAVGRAAWPEPRAVDHTGLRWSWPWLWGPWATMAACLLVAWWLPLPREAVGAWRLVSEPPAWGMMESWLSTLQQEKLADETRLEEWRQQLEELRAQSEKDWYSHQSLEATDVLRDSMERSLQQLHEHLGNATKSLQLLDRYAEQLTIAAKDQLTADLQAALQGLQANELPPDPELTKKLTQIDPKNLSQLSPEQLDSLLKTMKDNVNTLAQLCEKCRNRGFLGDGEGTGAEEMAELMKLMGLGDGSGIGQGGVSRGPGEATLLLGEESRLGSKRQEAVQNEDLSRAVPAELMGLGVQEHQLDQTERGPQAGGAADAGQGGGVVWQERLSPQERAVLKRYFSFQ